MNMVRNQLPTARTWLPESRQVQERRVREGIIEERLRALTRFVESFGHGVCSALLSERASTREKVEELCAKESGLRWIVRVAKHSEGLVRERLWTDIERAVTDLEKLAESVRTSAGFYPLPDSAAFPCAAGETVNIR